MARKKKKKLHREKVAGSTVSVDSETAESESGRANLWKLVLVVLTVSLILKTVAAFTSITPTYPDEVFQTLEVAHELVFGRGFVYWEYVVGARSWVLPGLLAAGYAVVDFLGVSDPLYINVGIKIMLGVWHSVAAVLVFMMFVRRFGNTLGFVLVLPFVLHYFGSYLAARTLSECIVIPVLVGATFFADRHLHDESRRDVVLAALLAGFGFMIRFQAAIFAVGLGIVILLYSRRRIASALLYGGVCAVMMFLIQGLIDLVTWGSFLKSLTTYFNYNIIQGVAARHGEHPIHFYFKSIYLDFPIIITGLVLLFVAVKSFSRKYAVLVVPTLFFLAIHLVFAHKETRFVFPVYYFLTIIPSLAVAEIAQRFSKVRRRKAVLVATALVLLVNGYGMIKFMPRWDARAMRGSDFSQSIDSGLVTDVFEISIALGRIDGLKHAYVAGMSQLGSGGHAYFHRDAEIIFELDAKRVAHEIAQMVVWPRDGTYVAIHNAWEKKMLPFTSYMDPKMVLREWKIYRVKSELASQEINPRIVELAQRGKEKKIYNKGRSAEILFGERKHNNLLEIQLTPEYTYEFLFLDGRTYVGRVILRKVKGNSQDGEGKLVLQTVEIPEETVRHGYTAVNVSTFDSGKQLSSKLQISGITLKNK
jgi:GPI mannosyltransferase 3